MPARRAHVFHVALPGQPLRSAARQRGHRGEDAAVPHGLPGSHGPREPRTASTSGSRTASSGSGPGRRSGRRSCRLRVVRGPVVGPEQHPLGAQRPRQVRRLRGGAPGRVEALVLDVHHEHVPRGRDGGGGAGAAVGAATPSVRRPATTTTSPATSTTTSPTNQDGQQEAPARGGSVSARRGGLSLVGVRHQTSVTCARPVRHAVADCRGRQPSRSRGGEPS